MKATENGLQPQIRSSTRPGRLSSVFINCRQYRTEKNKLGKITKNSPTPNHVLWLLRWNSISVSTSVIGSTTDKKVPTRRTKVWYHLTWISVRVIVSASLPMVGEDGVYFFSPRRMRRAEPCDFCFVIFTRSELIKCRCVGLIFDKNGEMSRQIVGVGGQCSILSAFV